MKFWIRRLFVTLTALALMAACGLAAFLWSFDPNSYKNALQVLVQQKLDRQLTIEGDLKVVFFPDIAIQARQVSLTERASDDIFASVDELRATIAILPLLKNHLVIEEITLSGLKAQVQRSQLGDFVLDDLLGWGQRQTPSATVGEPGLRMDDISVDIAQILIKKSEFTILDATRKQDWKLRDASLEFGRIKRGEPFKAELNARIQHVRSAAVAKFSAQAILNVDFGSKSVTAKNTSISFKGDFPENVWFEDALKKVDLSLTTPSLTLEPATGRVRLERFSLRTKGLREGAAFEFNLEAPLFDISNNFARADSVTSRLRMDGKPAIDARIVLDGLQGDRSRLLFDRSSLDLAIKRDARVFKLVMSSPAVIQPFLSTLSLSALQGEMQVLQVPVSKNMLSMPVKANLSFAYDFRNNARLPFSLAMHAENLDFANWLSEFGIDSILEGNATLDLQTRFASGSMSDIAQSLQGNLKLQVQQAALQGIDLSAGLDALQASTSIDKNKISIPFDRSKRTSFDTVDLELKLEAGLANVARLDMRAPDWTIKQGSPAAINFQNESLDMAVLLQLLSPQTLTTRRAVIQVRSLLIPLYLTGSFKQPEISIQWTVLDRDPLGRALKAKLLNTTEELNNTTGSSVKGFRKK